MINVLKIGSAINRLGGGSLTSLDGETQASVAAILHESWTPEQRAAYGVYAVDETPPAGQRWTGNFVDVEGVPAAEFVAITLDERKAAKRDAVNARLNAALTGGYTVESGTMSGKVLQTRDLDDRTNWLVSQASYSAAVAAGAGAVEGAMFRTEDDSAYTLSYADGLNVLLAMAAWRAACMSNSWALKDAIEAAEDGAALDAIDIEQGWPA